LRRRSDSTTLRRSALEREESTEDVKELIDPISKLVPTRPAPSARTALWHSMSDLFPSDDAPVSTPDPTGKTVSN
jgi:hypothetical protein